MIKNLLSSSGYENGWRVKALITLAWEMSHRDPMGITEYVYYRTTHHEYVRCPRCKTTLEREYVAYCDRCGQRLDWESAESVVIYLK